MTSETSHSNQSSIEVCRWHYASFPLYINHKMVHKKWMIASRVLSNYLADFRRRSTNKCRIKWHQKGVNLNRILKTYYGLSGTTFRHRKSPTNHITNQSVSPEFCWSNKVSWTQCFIIEHPLQITLQINQSQQSSVEVLRWVGDNLSSSNISYKITLQINQSDKSSVEVLRWVGDNVSSSNIHNKSHYKSISLSRVPVEVLRWVGDNVSSSNIHYKSHYKSISLTRVLLKYWGELETMFHHRTSTTNHITNQSVSAEFCWSIEVSWR